MIESEEMNTKKLMKIFFLLNRGVYVNKASAVRISKDRLICYIFESQVKLFQQPLYYPCILLWIVHISNIAGIKLLLMLLYFDN